MANLGVVLQAAHLAPLAELKPVEVAQHLLPVVLLALQMPVLEQKAAEPRLGQQQRQAAHNLETRSHPHLAHPLGPPLPQEELPAGQLPLEPLLPPPTPQDRLGPAQQGFQQACQVHLEVAAQAPAPQAQHLEAQAPPPPPPPVNLLHLVPHLGLLLQEQLQEANLEVALLGALPAVLEVEAAVLQGIQEATAIRVRLAPQVQYSRLQNLT